MDTIIIKELSFQWKGQNKALLENIDITIPKGEHIFIQGKSGSGKSSLLSLLVGINLPQTGSIELLGSQMNKLSAAERDEFRANHIGYIFQMFNLVPYLSVLDNVLLPCTFSKVRREKIQKAGKRPAEEAQRLLAELGLTGDEILHKMVTELSVGQQQRVAACRALIGSPEILIADEPTSSLDDDAQNAFIKLISKECKQYGVTLIFVSHDPRFKQYFDRIFELKEGHLILENKAQNKISV
jgi:putative ABC transport system ATP-binding protein